VLVEAFLKIGRNSTEGNAHYIPIRNCMSHFIKRPGKGRATYALIGPDKKTISDPRIDAINADLAAGMARDILEQRMRAVLDSYKPAKAPKAMLAVANQRLVLRCHEAKLREKVHLARPDDLKQRLLSCAAALGNVSIESASKDELLRALATIKSPSRRFEIARGINELLKYANRAERIYNPPIRQSSRVAFISIKDFKEKILSVPAPYHLVLGALFATGCRWGELPLAESVNGVAVLVAEQVRNDGTLGPTKNKKERHALILEPLQVWWEEYSKLLYEEKNKLRLEGYNIAYRLCKTRLGIRIHDLRHSYAVALRSYGFNTGQIAEFIGDTEQVCKERYLRHGRTEEELTRLRKLFG
jgi:integrase